MGTGEGKREGVGVGKRENGVGLVFAPSFVPHSLTAILFGTHLVKNYESHSRTNESQLKNKKTSPKLKMLGPLCNQTLQTLYYSILELRYSPSILKHNKDLLKCALLNKQQLQ